jgi:hypothetical protein
MKQDIAFLDIGEPPTLGVFMADEGKRTRVDEQL